MAQPPDARDPRETGAKETAAGRPAAPKQVTLPEAFGRYRVVKRLGRGAMGSVYLAVDTQLDRQVALKVPNFSPADGPRLLQRFVEEARAAAALRHPNLCPIYEAGQIGGVLYI